MRGQNSVVNIITTKQTKLSLRGQLHRTLGTLISPFKGAIIIEVPPPVPRPPPYPQIILFPSIDNHWDTPQEILKVIVIEAPPSFSPHSVQAKSLRHELY